MMSFGQSIKTCFRKYATFEGRASRAEYWWFELFVVLFAVLASIVATMLSGGNVESGIFALLVLIIICPHLAVTCRRLHDVGLSGWWQILAHSYIYQTFFYVADINLDNIVVFMILVTIPVFAYFVSIIWLIIMLCMPTKPGKNKYGKPPM